MEQKLQELEMIVFDLSESMNFKLEALQNRVDFLEAKTSLKQTHIRESSPSHSGRNSPNPSGRISPNLSSRSSPNLSAAKESSGSSPPKHHRMGTLGKEISPMAMYWHSVDSTSSNYNTFHHSSEKFSSNSLSQDSDTSIFVKAPSIDQSVKTCVQCLEDYAEGEDTDTSCLYHPGKLEIITPSKCVFTCCQVTIVDERFAKTIRGCTKGRHCSKHHCSYPYSNYFSYMHSLSRNAKEMWLQMDVFDPVMDNWEWGEVGISSEGQLFVIMGSLGNQADIWVELSLTKLKECKDSLVELVKLSDPADWCLTAELSSQDSIAKSIIMTLKPALKKTPLTKCLNLVYYDECFRPGEIEYISNTVPNQSEIEYTVPEETHSGPVLEPGEDYSVGRKNDYLTEYTDDFPVRLKQIGKTTVETSMIRLASGKWNNHFTATVEISTGNKDILIKNVFAEYLNKDGEWKTCDQIFVGLKDKNTFFDMKCFPVVKQVPLTLTIKTDISVEGPLPSGVVERNRAHYSLPQPFHLRVTFIGMNNMRASLRYEQGNVPIYIITQQMREQGCSCRAPFQFYLFADDVTTHKRSDAAIYYNQDGLLVYNAAPYGNVDNKVFLLTEMVTRKAAYQAKRYHKTEYELTSMRREKYRNVIRLFAMVDLNNECTYALKVLIKTTTSEATGYYLLPQDDFTSATLAVQRTEVTVNGDVVVVWYVHRAYKKDRIEIYTENGGSSVTHICNEEGVCSGTLTLKAPSSPGVYEARYYPACLRGSHFGKRHDVYVAKAIFGVNSRRPKSRPNHN